MSFLRFLREYWFPVTLMGIVVLFLGLIVWVITRPGPTVDASLYGRSEAAPHPEVNRFTVTRVATFGDGLAYGGVRGVYTITDTTTGRQYVGVSGVGISELGSHQAGKATVQDER